MEISQDIIAVSICDITFQDGKVRRVVATDQDFWDDSQGDLFKGKYYGLACCQISVMRVCEIPMTEFTEA